MTSEPRRSLDHPLAGFGMLMLAHVIFQYAYLVVYATFVKTKTLEETLGILVPLVWIGLSQCVYAIPLAVWLKRTGRRRAFTGFVVAVLLTAALDAAFLTHERLH